jgi:predicted TIM-barrel fold metal-dependent hydrolase
VLLTVSSPSTLHAAIEAAREFHTLRFVLSPQNEGLTTDALPAIKETLNVSLLPVAAFSERDAIAQAVATISERRVLWGSNWGRYHPAAAVGMIRDSAITGLQRERIVYRNAKELLS